MGATSSTKNDLLKLILQAVPIATVADNAASSPATVVQLSLHTALPTSQSTSVAAYTGYAHASVARSALGWALDDVLHEASNVDNVLWPLCTAGSPVEYSHVGISLSGVLRFTVTMPVSIQVSTGIQPTIPPGDLIVRAV